MIPTGYSHLILFTCGRPTLPPKYVSPTCKAWSLLLYQVHASRWSPNPSSLPSFCSSDLPSFDPPTFLPSFVPPTFLPSFRPDTTQQDEVFCIVHNLNFLYYKMDREWIKLNFISQWIILQMLSLLEIGVAPQMRKKLGVVLSTKVSGRHV